MRHVKYSLFLNIDNSESKIRKRKCERFVSVRLCVYSRFAIHSNSLFAVIESLAIRS